MTRWSNLTRRPVAGAVTTLTAAALLLGGCSGSSSDSADPTSAGASSSVLSDPRAYEGPSTATLADRAIEPIEDNPAQTLPATVTSRAPGGDTQVTVADTSRVVALSQSGSLAATVWGLGFGKTLVGRDVATTFPGADALPQVGDGHAVNAEALIALRPTLVLTDGMVGPPEALAQLRDVGITVVFVKPEPSFAGAGTLARDVAAVYGAPEAGEKLAQRIETEVQDATARVADLAPKDQADRPKMAFLYLRGEGDVYFLLGPGSGADAVIDAESGVDVGKSNGWGPRTPLTDEAITAANPDLVLVMTDGLKSVGGVDGLLQRKPALALTNAGKHKRFVDMDDGEILSFGPLSAEVITALGQAIYAPAPTK